ncbi:helix-turn-helix transcriptional regulator [Micrococcoides hystricis]|uniref:Helix-turn-helix transcriptional regulator n=1 Tax=Micrococcoides hystricis TaxID=1572761 RepID=A0ABV6P9L9_9MICC
MSLRAALLALLSSGPMTGYDVVKQFSGSVGYLWQAKDSQIYPALRKMEEEGLVEGKLVPWGSKGAVKTEYQVTSSGIEELRRWQESEHEYGLERDPVELRVAYGEWADPGDLERMLNRHIDHQKREAERALRQIADIEGRVSPVIKRRLERFPDADADRIVRFKVLAYQGRIQRAEAEIAWAKAVLREIGAADSD